MGIKNKIGIAGIILSLAAFSACGDSAEQVIELDPSVSDAVCVADADCTDGLVCEEGSCVEVIAPEEPETTEPEPEPEPEEPVACAANDECESGKCSSETLTCVDACPLTMQWKTPAGQVTGQCQEFSLTFTPTPPQSCLTDVDCQDGYVCSLGQCVKPDPIPNDAWM